MKAQRQNGQEEVLKTEIQIAIDINAIRTTRPDYNKNLSRVATIKKKSAFV